MLLSDCYLGSSREIDLLLQAIRRVAGEIVNLVLLVVVVLVVDSDRRPLADNLARLHRLLLLKLQLEMYAL